MCTVGWPQQVVRDGPRCRAAEQRNWAAGSRIRDLASSGNLEPVVVTLRRYEAPRLDLSELASCVDVLNVYLGANARNSTEKALEGIAAHVELETTRRIPRDFNYENLASGQGCGRRRPWGWGRP